MENNYDKYLIECKESENALSENALSENVSDIVDNSFDTFYIIIKDIEKQARLYSRKWVVFYESDLDSKKIKILNSEWFFVYLNEVLGWSLFRGNCYIRDENKSWGCWIIVMDEIKEDEAESLLIENMSKKFK